MAGINLMKLLPSCLRQTPLLLKTSHLARTTLLSENMHRMVPTACRGASYMTCRLRPSESIAISKQCACSQFSQTSKLQHHRNFTSQILEQENVMSWQPFDHSVRRGFKTKTRSTGNADDDADRLVTQLKHEEDALEENAGWLIRLSNENNYLSHCRNVYIATIAGVTMYGQFVVLPHSYKAGVLIIMMGGLNLLSGTCSYVYNLLHLREKILMRRSSTAIQIFLAVFHAFLWAGCMALYIGYIDYRYEDLDEEFPSPNQDQEQWKSV